MEWNDGCLFHRVMLAKRIQVSAKVNVAEGSVKGKAFGLGGNPQSKVKEGVETVSAQRAVRKISGLFLTKMSSLVRSGPKALPELCGGQCEPFLLLLSCLHRDTGCRSHALAVALTDGPISELLSLPVCSFLPLLTCTAAAHQRWGTQGLSEAQTQLPILLRRTQAGNAGSHASAAYLTVSAFPVGLEEAGWHFILPAQVVMTDLCGNSTLLSLTILAHGFRQLQEEEMEIAETQSGTSERRGR